jgi:hypothetical protein
MARLHYRRIYPMYQKYREALLNNYNRFSKNVPLRMVPHQASLSGVTELVIFSGK